MAGASKPVDVSTVPRPSWRQRAHGRQLESPAENRRIGATRSVRGLDPLVPDIHPFCMRLDLATACRVSR